MAWTLTVDRPNEPSLSITIRSPEFGDVSRDSRLQARGDTDGGVRYVQDLGRSVVTYEATWQNLTRCERDDIARFFGPDGTLRQARPFRVSMDDEEDAAVGITTGLGLSTGEGYTSGQLVASTGGEVWGVVYLDQPDLAFNHSRRDQRFDLALRFRIETTGDVPALA